MISFFGRKIFVYFILFFSLASGVSGGEKEMGAGMYSIVTLLIFFGIGYFFCQITEVMIKPQVVMRTLVWF